MTRAPVGADWVEVAGTRIARALSRAGADAEDGIARVVVSGGTTPEPVYRWLAQHGDVPWDRIAVYFGDERAVPPDHEQSNYRMVMESLVRPSGMDPARVHRMEAERNDVQAAARAYAELLPEPVPVLLLGIGKDAHTASLFPGGLALDERERRVVPVPAQGDRPARMTITPPVIASAEHLFVLARGADKAPAVARALGGPWDPTGCPAQLARRGEWLLDAEAAAGVDLPPGRG